MKVLGKDTQWVPKKSAEKVWDRPYTNWARKKPYEGGIKKPDASVRQALHTYWVPKRDVGTIRRRTHAN